MKKLIEYYSSPAAFLVERKGGKVVPAAGSNKTKSTNRQKPKKR